MNGRRKLSRTHKNRGAIATPATPVSVPYGQDKSTKAIVGAVLTVLGLVGIHVTTGTVQLAVMVAQVGLVFYGVWRARNEPKRPQLRDFQ